MGSNNAHLSSSEDRGTLGFTRRDFDNLLKTSTNLTAAQKRQADLVQKQDKSEKVGDDQVRNLLSIVRKRENDIFLRRTQPGNDQTRLLGNVAR